ncbi:MAG: single-stranded-DNA-specific exonuclease RecJ [Porcipelethomonas sp.]
MKRWIVRKPDREISRKIAAEADVSQLCADVLSARGFESAADAAKQLMTDKLSDPFLLKDMREAAEVINSAIENFDRICIYGDYDCDGITSTVMLFSYLECMGADVTYRIPERSEGYGLNPDAVRELAEGGVKLIVTVDNGISALAEAELIYELGMKLVVTDHHQPGEQLPRAEAVVNPHRKDCPSYFKKLCGAGVVLKLIAALEGGDYETVFNEYGELAAIGTVADIVELSGENRYIVSRGLQLIGNSERCGVNALVKISGVKPPVTSTSLAFGIAPRINASGRFGSPSLAARLLLTDDETEAEMLGSELDRLNENRKKTENEIIDRICERINSEPEMTCRRVMILSGEGWHHGVIGIVASRIMERFDKPCFIITTDGDEARGSARAFGNFSVYKALDYCSDLLVKFGGHMGAGGFSLKAADIPEFDRRLQEFAKINFDIMPVPDLIADKVISPGEMTVENISDLKILEPFGEGNSQPVFAVLGAEITDVIPLSKGIHTKLKIRYGNVLLDALLFRCSPDEVFLQRGDKADFMVTAETQTYNGRESISIIIKDYRRSGMEQRKYFAARDAYEKFRRSEQLPKAYYKKICPDRKELIPVYKTIAGGKYNTETLYMSMASENMNFCKLSLCVDIFKELGLVNINYFSHEINVVKNAPKADLESSRILNSIREKI